MNKTMKMVVKIIGILAGLAVIMVVGYFAGKNIKNSSGTGVAKEEAEELEKYIVLGEYKGIAVDQLDMKLDDITDEMLDSEIEFVLEDYKEYKEVTDRKVKKGDFINFDFEGEIDGEKPEDMTAAGYELTVGAGEFIEDLDAGLVGASIGKEKKIEVTFPEDYEAAYAGKKAVFTVKVNTIQEVSVTPELTDQFLKENTEYNSVEEMKDSIRKDLLQTEIDTSKDQMYSEIITTIIQNSELKEYPQEVFDEVYAEIRAEMEQGAAMFGMSFEEYLELSGASGDIPDEWVEERITENAVTRLILYKEKIRLSDKEYDEMLADNLDLFGVETVEEVTAEYDKQELTDYFLSMKLQDYLIENAEITKLSYDDYNKKYNAE